jgi:hypothetical protein
MPTAGRISMKTTRARESFLSRFHDRQPLGPSIHARQRGKVATESAPRDHMCSTGRPFDRKTVAAYPSMVEVAVASVGADQAR